MMTVGHLFPIKNLFFGICIHVHTGRLEKKNLFSSESILFLLEILSSPSNLLFPHTLTHSSHCGRGNISNSSELNNFLAATKFNKRLKIIYKLKLPFLLSLYQPAIQKERNPNDPTSRSYSWLSFQNQ